MIKICWIYVHLSLSLSLSLSPSPSLPPSLLLSLPPSLPPSLLSLSLSLSPSLPPSLPPSLSLSLPPSPSLSLSLSLSLSPLSSLSSLSLSSLSLLCFNQKLQKGVVSEPPSQPVAVDVSKSGIIELEPEVCVDNFKKKSVELQCNVLFALHPPPPPHTHTHTLSLITLSLSLPHNIQSNVKHTSVRGVATDSSTIIEMEAVVCVSVILSLYQ